MSNYVCFSIERSTKTRDGAGRNTARAVLPKLFAQTDDEFCPVAMYKAYKRHRPDDMLGNESRFYLQPLSNPKLMYGTHMDLLKFHRQIDLIKEKSSAQKT